MKPTNEMSIEEIHAALEPEARKVRLRLIEDAIDYEKALCERLLEFIDDEVKRLPDDDPAIDEKMKLEAAYDALETDVEILKDADQALYTYCPELKEIDEA